MHRCSKPPSSGPKLPEIADLALDAAREAQLLGHAAWANPAFFGARRIGGRLALKRYYDCMKAQTDVCAMTCTLDLAKCM